METIMVALICVADWEIELFQGHAHGHIEVSNFS